MRSGHTLGDKAWQTVSWLVLREATREATGSWGERPTRAPADLSHGGFGGLLLRSRHGETLLGVRTPRKVSLSLGYPNARLHLTGNTPILSNWPRLGIAPPCRALLRIHARQFRPESIDALPVTSIIDNITSQPPRGGYGDPRLVQFRSSAARCVLLIRSGSAIRR